MNQTLRYLANADLNPSMRGACPTVDEIRALVAIGLVVTISAPYPFAPCHAHLTPSGLAAYRAMRCGVCGHEPADEWLAGSAGLPCPRCGAADLGSTEARLMRERDDARYTRDAAEAEVARLREQR